MADFDAWEDPHYLFQHNNSNNSPLQPKPTARRGYLFCSSFLFRLLLIALFLSVLPLLPSDPPEFVSHTVFAKSWELLHLFIIGILVSYGLFGRRKSQIQTPIPSSPDIDTPNMLHASSIFSFEHHNPYNNGDQHCDLRPYRFEPTVVVRPGTFESHCEPLDLPVRSLRSRVEESDSEECASEFELEADGSSSCCSEEDMVDSSPTPWNWPNQSSSGDSGPSLSNQSSPLRSSSSVERGRFWREEVEVESSWKEPKSSKSLPMMADPKEEVGNLNPRSFRPSSSELPPMEVENLRRETKLFPSPPSLKSRSMRVNFKENVGDASLHVDTNFMPPPSSERRDSRREDEDVESSWSEPIIEENVFVSQPMPSKSLPMMADPEEEVGNVNPRSFRPSSSKGSARFRSSLAESPPIEVENSKRETKSFPSPPSLKSRSMRVDFKERIGDASLHEDTESVPPMCSFMPPPSSEFSPLCSTVSESPSVETEIPQREHKKRQHSKSFRSPMCNFMPPSLAEFSPLCSPASESPTTEVLIPQKESKEVDSSWKEMNEDLSLSSFIQDNDLLLRRVGSRRRRSRKRDDLRKDVKGTMKSRTDSLRSESSCDTTSSQSLSSSSHDFASTIEPKSSRNVDGFSLDENVHRPPLNGASKEMRSTEIEDFESESIPYKAASPINASNNDFVLSRESSSAQLGASSSLSKLERGRKTLSRTSHSRRFSCSSFFDRDLWKGSRDEAKEISKKGKNADASRSGKCGWDCLKLDVKPTLTTKGSVRGRSVRTVRPPASDRDQEKQDASLERVQERQDVIIISIGISEKNVRNAPLMAERSSDGNQEGRKHERSESSSVELAKNKERSDGKTSVTKDINEDEDGNSEIDRKADEFIAKFKEQIRLQQVVSRRESSKHRT